MIALIHAYSRRNAGDGLLVDLSLGRLERAGVPKESCEVFALDASSFSDLPHVHQVGVPGRRPSLAMVPAGAQLGASVLDRASGGRVRVGQLQDILARADAIVAVGGGYLRTGNAVSSLGTLLNHVPQLAAAARSNNAATLYLPQSIGPLRGPVGRLVRRLLGGIDVICVRDDRSLEELGSELSPIRFPDLALLQLAERLERVEHGAGNGGPVVLVGRALTDGGAYEERVVDLARRLGDVVWAAQADGVGSKSDLSFYQRLGVRADGRLLDVLRTSNPAAVVSTRLHGAIQALLAGVPAVHLGYERKSRSAYGDLGLADFVHDARAFDPETVAAQAKALAADPSAFWKRIEQQRPALVDASERLTALVRERLGLG